MNDDPRAAGVHDVNGVQVRRILGPMGRPGLDTQWSVDVIRATPAVLNVEQLEDLWRAIDEELERVYATTTTNRKMPERPYNRCGE